MSSSELRSYASLPDETLLSALQVNDQGAYAEIYERYWYRLFALAYRKLKFRAVAEELVQDLFEALWGRRAQHSIDHLESYLLAAINHRIISHVRAQKIRAGYAEYCQMRQEATTRETEERLAEADLSAAFLAGVHQLPEKSQQVFRLNRLEHYSVQEISLRLQVSPKAVEYHLTKSLKFLRTYLRGFLVLLSFVFFRQAGDHNLPAQWTAFRGQAAPAKVVPSSPKKILPAR